jgi:hypothetical protein
MTSPSDRPNSNLLDPRLQRLRGLLAALERRFRLQEAVTLLPWALGVALVLTTGLGLSMRLGGWPDLLALGLAGVAILLSACAGVFAFAFLRPRDALATALQADLRLGLDERLSTAVEDATKPPTVAIPSLVAMRDAQLDDALHSLEAVVPARELPVTFNRKPLLPSCALVLLLLAVLFVPGMAPQVAAKKADPQVAAEQKNIEVLKQAIEKSPNAADPALQKLLQELDALSHDLKEGDLTSEEALARLSDTQAELQKALDPQAAAQREALDQLAKQLATAQNSALKAASDALANNDPQKAAQEIAKAADSADKMTPEERKALAQDLRDARDSVAASDPELASRLNDAADALDSGDTQAAKDALQNLADKVENTGNDLATQKQIEQALSQIQQSKQNIAEAGQATPAPNSTVVAATTAGANGTPGASGTAVSASGSPVATSGTVVALGSPVSGTPAGAGTGTPVLAMGTPGQGTPVAGQGQGTPGAGQSQGQGQGAGQGQGQGQSQGQAQEQSAGPPAGGWGRGHEEPVYVPPSSVQADMTPVTVQGQDSPNGEQSTAPTNTDNNSTGQALTPYEDVYGQYKDQAGEALGSDYIPQGYKDLVRDYFSQIAPK